MSWFEKHRPTPFDDIPINGLVMLDGDLVYALSHDERFRGIKRPGIVFPSRLQCPLWPSETPEFVAEFFLFGEMGLPVKANREQAFAHAQRIGAQYGYGVTRMGQTMLEVWDERDEERVRVTYDEARREVLDAVTIRTRRRR